MQHRENFICAGFFVLALNIKANKKWPEKCLWKTLFSVLANLNFREIDSTCGSFKKDIHAPDEKTMIKLGSTRLLLSRESQLITAQDKAIPMLTLHATLMLAIRCSHYSSVSKCKVKTDLDGNEKLPNHLDLKRSVKSIYPWSLWQCFSVCIDSHFLFPCSSHRVSNAGAEHSTASTVPRSASKGGNQ